MAEKARFCLLVFCIVLHRPGSSTVAFVFVFAFCFLEFADAFRGPWALCALNKLTTQAARSASKTLTLMRAATRQCVMSSARSWIFWRPNV